MDPPELAAQLEARTRELVQAADQLAATSEVLRAISNSRHDPGPVLKAVAEHAARLCDADITQIFQIDGELLRVVASHGPIPSRLRGEALRITRGSVTGRSVIDRRTIHVHDLSAELDTEFPDAKPHAGLWGHRTTLATPLLREGAPIGAIFIRRTEVRPFSEQQIALLETFADQAVIAMENVRLFKELEARNKDLAETLEQQTATAGILRVISGTPTDTKPVFDAIVDSAVRLFNGMGVAIVLVEGDRIELAAGGGPMVSEHPSWRAMFPMPLDRESASGRSILDRAVVDIDDIETPGAPLSARDSGRLLGYRAVAQAPMLREGVATGAIGVIRRESGAFGEKRLALLKTFADQAVIAIQNARLFNETKEALERQTATSEILRVISSSPTDIQPVLDAVAENAARLCGAMDAIIQLREGDMFRFAAHYGSLPNMPMGATREISRELVTGRALLEGRQIQINDLQAETEEYPQGSAIAKQFGYRTILVTPLMRDGAAIGTIMIRRAEALPFSDSHLALVKTFADQAVIAIENVRLFNETKEALARQAAAAQVLRSISESVSDTAPVFTAILECCNRLIPSIDYVQVQLIAGSDWVRLVDHRFGQVRGAAPGKQDERRAELMAREAAHFPRPLAGSTLERALSQGRVVILADTLDGPDTPPRTLVDARRWGHSYSQITVPLMREGRCIGAIEAFRRQLGGFEAKESSLLESFADQAVIAIENVRLFKELQARTEALTRSVGQLTALGEVGQAISSTLDLETVLKTIVNRAMHLTGLDGGVIYEYDDATGRFELRASENFDEESVLGLRGAGLRKGEGAVGGSVVAREPRLVPDTHSPDYPARLRDLLDTAGFRAVLAVPLQREDQVIGALMMLRKAPGPFAPEIVELLKTFATQSAMAIQNARLFREIAEKGKQLEVASQHKSNFLASMSHELRTPLNAILGFNEMILDEIYGPVAPDVRSPLEEMQASGKHLLRLINNVLDLAKIEAGRMELSLQDYSVHDTVESVRSTLRSIAAEKGLELLTAVPGDIPLAYGDPGRMSQCLLNLAGNALKFTKAGKVEIGAKLEGDQLVYRVSDTGIGIPADKIGSLFTEFKQTDATIASEYGGTGLGLSITKKFIEMHGGRIWIESELGKGSAFIFEVPLRAKTT